MSAISHISNMGATLTFTDLNERTIDFAAFLQTELALNKGDRIAIALPNILQYPIALLGALRAGLVVVNTNPLYTARELKHQLCDSEATTIIMLENFAHLLQDCLENTSIKNIILTRLGDLLNFPRSLAVNAVARYSQKSPRKYDLPNPIWFKDVFQKYKHLSYKPVDLRHQDIAFLQYTGGTIGFPKGAMLSHGNMIANVEQASAWFQQKLEKGREHIVTALPLYHIFSLTANCLMFIKWGGHNHLLTNPRDLPRFIRTIKNIRFTAITGVNTFIR